jgi:hypothetical protein
MSISNFNNKVMETTSKVEKLRELIVAEIELCDQSNTPYICSNASDLDVKAQMVETILQTVLSRKMQIGQAILEYEQEFNPNMLD